MNETQKKTTFSPVTAALHTRVKDDGVAPVVAPIYQNSAFHAHSPYFYTRKANPNSEELEQVVGTLEQAPHALSVTTGMAAIASVVGLLRQGDTVVLNKDIYGCSFKFFQRRAETMKLDLHIVDLSTAAGIAQIPAATRMVFFETPTNPFLKTVTIQDVADQVRRTAPRALVVVDNTWGTPLFQKPLQHGADVSLYSATKYFSGHSDVMGGIVVTARKDLDEELRAERFYAGAILDPHSAWLLRRSMQTFALRMDAHQRTTKDMTQFLGDLPQVTKVYYPKVDGKQLTGYGGIVFVELRDDLTEHYRAFAEALQLFDTGTGMACVTSMVAQPFTGSHASMSDAEKQAMGLGKNVVRLCFGLESPEDLKADLRQAFQSIDKGSQRG